MTLPRDIHGGFLGTDGNIKKKGAPPPISTTKPTARILPLPTNNPNHISSDSNTHTFANNSTQLYNNQIHQNRNNYCENTTFFFDPSDLSEDIATANIKTKISQFEYLASRNYDRCPKFPLVQEKDLSLKDSRLNNGYFIKRNVDEKCVPSSGKVINGSRNEDNALMTLNQKQIINRMDCFDEDPERIEKTRLEEILTICAEYEKQAQLEKNVKLSPNRIKTNGSLPRERRTISSSSDQQSPSHLNQDYHLEYSPFPFDVPPNSASSLGTKQRPFFDFNNLPSRDYNSTMKDQFADLDFLSEQLRKTCAVEHVSRNRIKTTMTPYRDGHPSSPYSTPQSPQFNHFPNRFNNTPNDFLRQTQSPTTQTPPPKLANDSFKYLTLPKDTKLVSSIAQDEQGHLGGNKFSTSDAENLTSMRKDLERAMVKLRAKLSENDSYYEELVREFELEKALLIAEYKSGLTEKRNLQSRQQISLQRVQQIEKLITETQMSKDNDQVKCGEKLANAQEIVKDIESNLSVLSNKKQSDDYQRTFDKYLLAQEVLDNERKAFEDVEFHHLEKEADLLASKEELQRELRDLAGKMDELNICLKDLKGQLDHLNHTHTITNTNLERTKLQLHQRIEETRNHLKLIDLDMNSNSASNNNRSRKPPKAPQNSSASSPSSMLLQSEVDYVSNSSQCSGQNTDDTDEDDEEDEVDDSDCDGASTRSSGSYVLRVEKVGAKQNDLGGRQDCAMMTQSVDETLMRRDEVHQLFGDGYNRAKGEFSPLEKKTPSQGDIDRICKVTSNSPMNIIDDSVNLGKKTIESLLEIERNRHLHLVETGSEVIENERRRVSELKQKAQEEVRSEWARRKPEFSSTLNSTENNSNISDDENNSKGRNSSDNSVTTTKEMDLDSPSSSGNIKRSTAKDKQRPLTRYLPIRSADLDLRQHIVSAGHQVILCPYVSINSSICKGFLHKKRSKFNNWSRRWFVFDRTKRSLVYYTDKNEKKTKGGAYFQAIQDVYLDHSNSIKSPSPHLTFVMKTQQRVYYLMAPSAESMRIWIDVIFTGAEGYCGFGQNF